MRQREEFFQTPTGQVGINAGRKARQEALKVLHVLGVFDVLPVDQLHLLGDGGVARADRAIDAGTRTA